MKAEPRTFWIVSGAVVGGILAGAFHLEPGWLWGMGGGIAGGAVGVLAGFLFTRSWTVWVRVLLALAVFVGGQAALWLLLGFAKTAQMFVDVAQPQ